MNSRVGSGCLKQLTGGVDEHKAGFYSWSFPEAGEVKCDTILLA